MFLPSHISPNLLFDYLEHGFAYMGNPKQSLLLDFPKTQQDIEYHDPYVQNLDALLKGQLNIDVAIDTDVLNAANDERIFDPGWRAQNGIEGFWDRSFYNSKFYAYYGYGPMLLLHLPVYLITNSAPSISLALFYFSTFAIIGLYLGILAVVRFFGLLSRTNILIWIFSQAAAVLGTHVLLSQSFFEFYSYASTLTLALIGFLTYLLYTIPSMKSMLKKRLTLGAIGIIIVLIVQTRPLALFAAMILCCPMFWALISAQYWQQNQSATATYYRIKDKLLDAFCISLPVAVGAIITMILNYLRFGSIFDFGQKLCFTWENQLYNGITFSCENISAMVEMYITRSWVDLVDFPYYGILYAPPLHIGNFIPGTCCVGLFASPVWWGLAFVLLLFYNQSNQCQSTLKQERNRYAINQTALLKITLVTLCVYLPVMSYIQMTMVSFNVRFLMENLAPLVPFVVLLWCNFINYDSAASTQSKICYWATLVALVITVISESLVPFSLLEQNLPFLVPDEWISAQDFFTPISTVR